MVFFAGSITTALTVVEPTSIPMTSCSFIARVPRFRAEGAFGGRGSRVGAPRRGNWTAVSGEGRHNGVRHRTQAKHCVGTVGVSPIARPFSRVFRARYR